MGTSEIIVVLLLIFVLFIAFMTLTSVFSHRATTTSERMKLIEKGVDVSKLEQQPRYPFPWLKLGIVVLGIGIGLLIIAILAANNLLKGSGALPMSIVTICGGVSLIIAHYANKS